MSNLTITPLESQVMEWLLAGDDNVLKVLRKQYHSSTIKSRENTGVGFYLIFDVPHDEKIDLDTHKVKTSFCFGDIDVLITTDRVQQSVDFLIWVEDGYLAELEACTYGLAKWPEIIDDFSLRYFENYRDLEKLRKCWEL